MADKETFFRCVIVIIIIIVVLFILIGLTLWWWEDDKCDISDLQTSKLKTPTKSKALTKSKIPDNTTDNFTYAQYVSAKPGQSAQQEIKATNGTILGEARQVFLPPPVNEPSTLKIDSGETKYVYRGNGANGFEIRWLGYTNDSTIDVFDLSDLQRLTVDVMNLELANSNTTFTLQVNVLDQQGLESSVVDIIKETKTAAFDRNSFIGNEPGQRIDWSKITGIWMGGDFRTTNTDNTSSLKQGGSVTLKPLTFIRN